jgi:farnesyl diphosphate synthase
VTAFKTAMADAASRIEARIDQVLTPDDPLIEPMGHALRGGKMFRAFLVLEGSRLHGVDEAVAVDAAMAIECIHAYSLVHDDLPCMDDDDLRRGQPTVHKKWDEATAVLVGDNLQSLAFQLITGPGLGGAIAQRLAVDARAMVKGQMLDIAAETAKTPLTLDQIIELQQHKTGALIKWAAVAGPLMAGADISPMSRYADALGLAFQIADDLLDVEGDAATVGKAVGKDNSACKATFVSLLGLDEAKRRAADLVQEAQDALNEYGTEADVLREAAAFVVSRKK